MSADKKLGWFAGLAAGAAALIGVIVLWPKKAAAKGTNVSQDFSPGGNITVPMKVGDSVTIGFPPGVPPHMDDFAGSKTIVGVSQTSNASTGYTYVTLTALKPGNVQSIIDTHGQTHPMTININVT